MRDITFQTAGTFSWAQLATSDSAAAKLFYSKLFDWKSQDVPVGPDMIYTMLTFRTSKEKFKSVLSVSRLQYAATPVDVSSLKKHTEGEVSNWKDYKPTVF